VVKPSKPQKVVNVLVDSAAKLGALSYLVPAGLTLTPGDAVHVPFGTRTAHGIVLGVGDSAKATREVIAVFGRRAHQADVETARELARRHLCALEKLVPRFAPSSAKGAAAVPAGPVVLRGIQDESFQEDGPESKRALAWCTPNVDRVRYAANEAVKLSAHGQVLVLCPTVALVTAVLSQFESGAARLDAAAARGAWSGFVEGSVAIGVGTRAAALYSPQALGGIVVLDPEHPGHIEAQQPHTHARDVALLRSEKYDTHLTMVSSTCEPAALASGVKLRIVGESLPSVVLLDRSATTNGVRLIPTHVQIEVKRALEHGTVCVVAPGRCRLVCAQCRSSRTCSLDHHPTVCSCTLALCERCGSEATKPSGWDATRLTAVFASYPHAKNLRCIAADELTKVHGCSLTVVLDADSPTKTATLQPELAQLRLLQAAAGTLTAKGTLLLCTQDATQPLLQRWNASDRRGAARVCYRSAKESGLPPFGRLVLVRIARQTAPSCANWPGHVHGPRMVKPGEWEVLVRCTDDQLELLNAPLERLRRSAKIRITVS
jgi:primosomal protein N'